ncbi:MAG: hypothetical protein J2P18_06950 [Nocardia sp.]|nr:hypothetical protein [Nocardia sp.]
MVEALAVALRQIADLRTEIADLETTVAELTHPERPPLPWPLSVVAALLTDPAGVINEQRARWESFVEEILHHQSEPRTPYRALDSGAAARDVPGAAAGG